MLNRKTNTFISFLKLISALGLSYRGNEDADECAITTYKRRHHNHYHQYQHHCAIANNLRGRQSGLPARMFGTATQKMGWANAPLGVCLTAYSTHVFKFMHLCRIDKFMYWWWCGFQFYSVCRENERPTERKGKNKSKFSCFLFCLLFGSSATNK